MNNDVAARCKRVQCECKGGFRVLTKCLLAAGICAGILLDRRRRLGVCGMFAVFHAKAPKVGRIDNAHVVDKLFDSLQQTHASADFQYTHIYLSVAVEPMHIGWCHLKLNAKVSSESAQDVSFEMI